MKTSQKGIDLIKSFESFQAKSYLCPANVWTIGYGHTKGVRKGQIITQSEAERLLKEDLSVFEAAVNRICKDITQRQFDALVSLAFNIGTTGFDNSTLVKLVKSNPNNPAIRSEFAKWKYAKGKILPGLVRRREAEANLYFEN